MVNLVSAITNSYGGIALESNPPDKYFINVISIGYIKQFG